MIAAKEATYSDRKFQGVGTVTVDAATDSKLHGVLLSLDDRILRAWAEGMKAHCEQPSAFHFHALADELIADHQPNGVCLTQAQHASWSGRNLLDLPQATMLHEIAHSLGQWHAMRHRYLDISHIVPASNLREGLWNDFVGPVDRSPLPETVEQRIVLELQSLENGWDGPDSLAPSAALIDEVKAFFEAVEISFEGEPDVQVDEDGTVAMFWRAGPGRIFSANFNGTGVIVISNVSPVAEERLAERVIVRDPVALLRVLAKSKMSWAVSRRA